MTDEQKSLIQQFEDLKDKASKKDKNIVKEFDNCVDTHYFYSLSALFQLQRINAFTEKDIETHFVQLCNRYTADKGMFLRYQKTEKDTLQRRMKSCETLTKLIKTADNITEVELYELFTKLIASTFDDVSAKSIQEKFLHRTDIQAVFENLTENAIYDLLNSYCHMPYKLAFAIIEEAKKSGEGHGSGYKVTYEGEKFNLYRIPGVI